MPRRQREETSQEREERLAIKRRRYHIRRQEMLGKETDIERQHRLSEEALRKRIIRGKSHATITKGIQGNMLNYGVEDVTVEGRRETLQQQEERVQKYKMKNDAIRKKNIRANAHAIETEEIRASRLHICAQQKAKNRLIIREMETNEQRSRRLHQQAEEQQISREKRSTYRLARTNTNRINVDLHHSGELNHECYTCGAVKFKHDGTKCCHKGKVHLPPLQEMPKIFYDLLTGYHPNSKEFKTHIRTYNSALAFVSFGANIEQFSTRGPYCFKIHGQVYHRMGAALPNPGEKPKYAQLYILDTEYATIERAQNPQNVECDSKLLKKLDEELRIVNPFAEALQMMHEAENDARLRNDAADIRMYFNRDRTDVDPHRYNAAFENGVAIIFVNPDGEPPFNRDICIHYRGGGLKNVPITHHSIDALTYPILLPCGDDGWSIGMKKAIEPGSFNTRRRENVSMLQYYSYRLATRKNKQGNNLKFAFNPLLSAGKLTQQFIVDAYARVEANNLCFIRTNQKKLRSEMYDGLIDYVNHEAEHQGMNSGKLVILPSTFSGSTRALNQNYQDSIALIRRFGKADIFITFTCNTHWSEIKDNLEFGQSPEDRPDLVSRVFQTKLKSFFHDVLEDHIFGKPKAFTYTIEFQKRGLPHCHMLLILDQIDKIRNNNDIDEITSAEIPDPISDPELHDIVMKHMVHGPCGPRCQARNEKTGLMECTKGFPKKSVDSTVIKPNGYPEYRRRKGAQYKKGDMVVDNSMIVPYNPYLARKYGAHINVEQCFSVNSVKYIYKYIHKGHDRACIKITNQATTNLTATYNWDEVQAYIDARYISAPEAIWRLEVPKQKFFLNV